MKIWRIAGYETENSIEVWRSADYGNSCGYEGPWRSLAPFFIGSLKIRRRCMEVSTSTRRSTPALCFLRYVFGTCFWHNRKLIMTNLGIQSVVDLFFGTQICFWVLELSKNCRFPTWLIRKSWTMFLNAAPPEGIELLLHAHARLRSLNEPRYSTLCAYVPSTIDQRACAFILIVWPNLRMHGYNQNNNGEQRRRIHSREEEK